MLHNLQAIILAGGKSKRFNTGKNKLAEKICGKELVSYPIELLQSLYIPTTVVVGHQKDVLIDLINKNHPNLVHIVVQEEQHGTGHAILCARNEWQEKFILILYGDAPLLSADIIKQLYKKHIETNAAISFVMAHNCEPNSASYGRVITKNNKVEVVDAHLFEGELHEHCDINAGIYLVNKEFLSAHVSQIERCSQSNEFYITDLIKIASENNLIISSISAPFDQIRGINTMQELWAAEQIKRSELIKHWMDQGVRFAAAQSVHLDYNVTIGAGSYIGSGVHVLDGTIIGKNCTIEAFSIIKKSILEDDVTVYSHSVITESTIKHNAQVGPFAHITQCPSIGENTVVGNFVEIKRSHLGQGTKAKHLSYLGDTTTGQNVNIGAGTITCNHDTVQKHPTTIQDSAYVGSNTSIIAPVTIGKSAIIAAGSTITQDVPEDALAIARAYQKNKNGYAAVVRKNAQERKDNPEQAPEKKEFAFMGAVKTNNDESPLN